MQSLSLAVQAAFHDHQARTYRVLGGVVWGLILTSLALLAAESKLYDALVSNTWSLGDGADATNALLLEPFATYNITEQWYLIIDPVITADWNAPSSERWVVPVGGGFGKTFSIARQAVNTNLQAYWNAANSAGETNPDWTLLFTFQLLFSK